MEKKRTSKARTITRVRKNISTSSRRKEKRLTSAQKLILHLNEALAIENAAVQRLQSRIKQTIVENAEIILYDMLTHLAERLNAADAIAILSETLSEERAMADWIKTNMPD